MLDVSQRIPKADLFILKENRPESTSGEDFSSGKRLALFDIPGTYTHTGSASHSPRFPRAERSFEG